eukprot:CAMPEP_0198316798 /NCGR_PEP_ID=MMETSP1450-20131203/6556_1 /TAXON_ID=753684 ORGANISM="Madagascaria erythrocladiodes, Strain CCMP3234" /NCGR_SAMPLE_ID=MMETSP1450 /ASSEMBLY_ACC=CAM_ASM_001115 /LENGTH=220 /DNA_ID=CAMNT_0044019969 /DNA_START=860 /DNA_END=1519 /DNA_ORIENTATION=+
MNIGYMTVDRARKGKHLAAYWARRRLLSASFPRTLPCLRLSPYFLARAVLALVPEMCQFPSGRQPAILHLQQRCHHILALARATAKPKHRAPLPRANRAVQPFHASIKIVVRQRVCHLYKPRPPTQLPTATPQTVLVAAPRPRAHGLRADAEGAEFCAEWAAADDGWQRGFVVVEEDGVTVVGAVVGEEEVGEAGWCGWCVVGVDEDASVEVEDEAGGCG